MSIMKTLAAILVLATTSFPVERFDAARRAEVIVVGTFKIINIVSSSQGGRLDGSITVAKCIYGKIGVGQVIKYQYECRQCVPFSDSLRDVLAVTEGQKMWLLSRGAEEYFTSASAHFGDLGVRPLKDVVEVEKYIKRRKR